MIEISLVILTCNQRDYTLRCLDSLRIFMENPANELILVDNGSTDNTIETVRNTFKNIHIIKLQRNVGVAAGRNIGLRAANGRHLMILDNDTIADTDTIVNLSKYLDENTEIGLVAPRLISPKGDVQTSYRAYPGLFVKISNVLRGKRRTSITNERIMLPIEPFYVIGAAQMFTKEVYMASNGLDENIFYGPEDADFCMSVRAIGKKVVYLPQYTIIHDWQRSTTSRFYSRSGRRHIKALIYFYKKHRRWW